MCDCNSGNTYHFNLGCTVPVVANAYLYYTKEEVDEKIDDIVISGGGITSGEVQTMIDSSISGKADTSAVTESINAAVSGKADTTAITNIDSAITNIDSAITQHTSNGDIHVTSQDKTNWNNKSNFSGDYNDLTNKPTIPTVPTSNTAFTNDAGYITSSALNGYATTGDVQTATNDMATQTWVGNQGYLTQHQDISGKQDVSGMTAYTSTATTDALNTVVTAHTANTDIHVTTAQTSAWNAKSDFSGSYNDLTNKPTIPSVWYGTKTEYNNIAVKDPDTIYFIYE